MKYLKTFLFTVLMAVTLIGCGTPKLEPGGAYAPVDTNGVPTQAADPVFYILDSTFMVAHGTIDLIFKFEYDNRATLWKLSPSINANLNKIRPEAEAAKEMYLKARYGYMLKPTPAGLDLLRTALAKMQQITIAAEAVVPQALGK